MNLKPPPTPMRGLADMWPGIEANIRDLQRKSLPEPSIWTLPSRREPKIRPPSERSVAIAESLASLAVGEARIVYSVRQPGGFMRKAAGIEGAYDARRAPDHGKNAWIVERVA